MLGLGGAIGRRLGLGALLVALRKVYGRRDEELGRASSHIVIEARVVAEAHATLWIVGFGSVQGFWCKGADYSEVHSARWVATCLASQEAFHAGLWCQIRQSWRLPVSADGQASASFMEARVSVQQ